MIVQRPRELQREGVETVVDLATQVKGRAVLCSDQDACTLYVLFIPFFYETGTNIHTNRNNIENAKIRVMKLETYITLIVMTITTEKKYIDKQRQKKMQLNSR